MIFSKRLLAVALAAVMIAPAIPAVAAQSDIDLLASYVGEWRGRGTMTTTSGEESVVCKLSFVSTQVTKLNYNGRCTLAGGNLAINGTMAYIAEKNRYEAVMSSNTRFTGVAIGTRRGSGIDFTLRQKDPDSGQTVDIDVGFALKNDRIDVDFTITDVASGHKNTANVPFERRS